MVLNTLLSPCRWWVQHLALRHICKKQDFQFFSAASSAFKVYDSKSADLVLILNPLKKLQKTHVKKVVNKKVSEK